MRVTSFFFCKYAHMRVPIKIMAYMTHFLRPENFMPFRKHCPNGKWGSFGSFFSGYEGTLQIDGMGTYVKGCECIEENRCVEAF